MSERTYLGDGVYASFDDYQIWLTTEHFDGLTSTIAIDPQTYEALKRYAKEVWKHE